MGNFTLTTNHNDQPAIYVACLAAYNHGKLHGKWLTLSDYTDVEELRQAVKGILAESPIPDAEEYAIHDYENFEGLNIDEYTGLESVFEIAQHLDRYGEAYALFCDNLGEIADGADFEEVYIGEYDSETDFAEEIFSELYEVPDNIRYYIDYEAFARDLFIGDYFSCRSSGGGVYVFANR